MVLQAALTGGGTQADSASLEELSGACLNQATLKNPLNSEVGFFLLDSISNFMSAILGMVCLWSLVLSRGC